MLRIAAAISVLCLPSVAGAMSAEKTATLFEAVRADLPCMKNAEDIARRFGLYSTGAPEQSANELMREYGSRKQNEFLLTSEEIHEGQPQNAVSVSIYETAPDFPPKLTNAFADIWGLPVPTPLRTDPTLAQFHWMVSFPNGKMDIIVSFNPESGLSQIYGRTIDLTEDQINVCSR